MIYMSGNHVFTFTFEFFKKQHRYRKSIENFEEEFNICTPKTPFDTQPPFFRLLGLPYSYFMRFGQKQTSAIYNETSFPVRYCDDNRTVLLGLFQKEQRVHVAFNGFKCTAEGGCQPA